MEPREYEYLYRLEETFWWFVAMRHITDAVLAGPLQNIPSPVILDAGCGTGINLEHFSRTAMSGVFGFDISSHAINGARKRGLRRLCQASVTDIPFADSTFDLVLSFEVLDQLSPSLARGACRELHRVLRPGGVLFVRVPAFEWMRSSHDTGIGNNHRYTRDELVEVAVAAGFKVEWNSYANTFLLPVVLARRLLKSIGIGPGSDVRPLPAALAWLDPVFRTVLKSEAALFRAGLRLPVGVSLLCVARK
jgi:SAM-dependent methyltransferase